MPIGGGRLVGSNNPRRDNYGVLIVDVFASRIVFRRFDVRDGKEYKADDPWMIPWPFDPSTAPYRAATRKEKSKVPAFLAGTALKVALVKRCNGCFIKYGRKKKYKN